MHHHCHCHQHTKFSMKISQFAKYSIKTISMCWCKKKMRFCQKLFDLTIDRWLIKWKLNCWKWLIIRRRLLCTLVNVSTVWIWIFDSLRIQIKSNTKYTLLLWKMRKILFFLLSSSLPPKESFIWICHWLLDFWYSSKSVCCSFNWVDSIKMLRISNELHPYVCFG